MKSRAVGAAIAVVLAVAPAGAEQRTSAAGGGERPAGSLSRADLGKARAQGALLEVLENDRTTLDALARAVDRSLTTPKDRGGLGAVSVRCLAERAARAPLPSSGTADHSSQGEWYMDTWATEDVDADGKDEVLTIELPSDWSLVRVRALDGSDASAQWSLTVPFVNDDDYFAQLYLFLLDADGDGDQEIGLARMSYAGILGGAYLVYADRISVPYDIRVFDEQSGAQLWRTSAEGTAYTAEIAPYGPYVASVEDMLVGVEFVTRLGSMEEDLLLETLDYTYAAAGSAESVEYHVTASVVDAATGDVMATRSSSGDTTFPWVTTAADLSGDGVTDFVVLGSDEGEATLSATPMDSETPYWTVPAVDGYLSVWAEPVTGALSDVLVDAYFTDNPTLSVYRPNGQLAWTRPNESSFAFGIGDVDGDGGTELLELTFVDLDHGWGEAKTLLSGDTGDPIWGPVVVEAPVGPGQVMESYLCCLDDLTGDGVADPISAVRVGDDDREGEEPSEGPAEPSSASTVPVPEGSVTGVALDGATGEEMWRRTMPGYRSFAVPLRADADGDGDNDLAWTDFVTSETNPTRARLVVQTLDGRTLEPLWRAARDGFPRQSYSYAVGGDLAGDGGAEVVVSVWSYVQDVERDRVAAFSAGGWMWTARPES